MADLYELQGRISVDTTQQDKALAETQKSLVKVQKEYEKTEKSAKENASGSTKAANDVKQANESAAKSAESSAKTEQKANQDKQAAYKKTAQIVATSTKEHEASYRSLSNALGVFSPRLANVVRETEQVGSAMGSTSTALALAAGGVVALGAGAITLGVGMFALTKGAADAADKYYDLSQQLNFSAHELSALDIAAEQSGTTLERISASLGIFDKNLEAAAEGNKKFSNLFKVLGVDITDNNTALEQMFTVLSKLPNKGQQTALAMQVFGKSGKDVLGIVKQANGDLPEFIRQMDKLAATVSDKDAFAANEFNDKLKLLSKQFDSAKVKVATELMPVFEDLFNRLSSWLANNQGQLKAWGEAFASAASAAVTAAGVIHSAYSWMSSIAPNDKDNTSGGYFGHLFDEGSYSGKAVDYVKGLFTDNSSWQKGMGAANMSGPTQTAAQIQATATVNGKPLAVAKGINPNLLNTGGGGSKGGGEAAKTYEALLKAQEDYIRAFDRLNQRGNQANERSYTRGIESLSRYVNTASVLANTHLVKELDALDKEQALVEKNVKNEAQRNTKLQEIADKRQAALDKNEDQMQRIADFREDQKRQTTQARADALMQINDTIDASRIEQIKRNGEKQIGAEAQVQAALLDIELTANDRQQAEVMRKRAMYDADSEEYKRLSLQLGVLETQKGAILKKGAIDDERALESDLEAFRKYNQEILALKAESNQAAIDLQRAQAEHGYATGNLTPKQLKAQTAQIDTNEELFRAKQQLIQREADYENAAKNQSLLKQKQLRRLYDDLEVADEQALQERLKEIRDRAQVEMADKQRQRLDEIRQGFISAFMDGFSHIQDGFGAVLKTMVLDFTHAIAQMILQAEAAKIAKALFSDDSVSSGGGGGKSWLGKFLKMGLSAAAGGLAPTGNLSTGGSTPIVGNSFASPSALGLLAGRASGGPVLAGMPYMVGENGPELFTPNSQGSILNSSQSKGMGGDVNHFHFNISTPNAASFMSRETQAQIQRKAMGAMKQASRSIT